MILAGGLVTAESSRLALLNQWPVGLTGPYWAMGPAGAPTVGRVFFSQTPPESPQLYDVWIQLPPTP